MTESKWRDRAFVRSCFFLGLPECRDLCYTYNWKVEKAKIKALIVSVVVLCTYHSFCFGESAVNIRYRDWVSSDFADCDLGPLTDQGSIGGSWGSPSTPAGVTAKVVESEGVRCLSFDTSSVASNLSFAATMPKGQVKTVEFTMSYSAADGGLAVPEGTKAAFMIGTNGVGRAAFLGYTKDGWKVLKLQSGALRPVFDAWFTAAFMLSEGDEKVSYAVMTPQGYETLVLEEDGETTKFATGATGPAKGLFEVCGTGALRGFESVFNPSSITLRNR